MFACSRLSALKYTHVKQVMRYVVIMIAALPRKEFQRFDLAIFVFLMNDSMMRNDPWSVPQMTNIHEAPCHMPPRSIVIMRLICVLVGEMRLPPSGM